MSTAARSLHTKAGMWSRTFSLGEHHKQPVAVVDLLPRLEIRQLEQNADQWNVYLLGLNRFQQMTQSDKLSYYQIAGIHGRPFIPWDGVLQASGGSGGYCAHSSNLFPPWHRPYLALFEEILYLNAREAVNEFPAGELRERYTAALSTLRMPYWDWATPAPAGQDTLPSSLQLPTAQVITPNGTNTIPNPLFAYNFHPLSSDDFPESPYSSWPSTLRDPSSPDPNSTSRNDQVASQLNDLQTNLQSRIYHIFTMITGYSDVSNDYISGDSLEAVHDTIHNTVGSGGHMSDVPYAAFDPIFWLHHTMIDRCFAIWQALYPDNYVEPMPQILTTFAVAEGTVENATSPLFPFHLNDQGDFWTSNSVRSTATFGYTYPELQNGNDTAALKVAINILYGTGSSPQKRGYHLSNTPDNEPVSRAVVAASSRSESHAIAGAPSYSSERQYITNIKVRRFGLGGSYSIFVFIGEEPTSEPSQWSSDPSFVGISGVFAAATNDPLKTSIESNGVVPLTAALEARLASGKLKSMKEDAVGAYLRDNLHWKIRSMDSTEILIDQVQGLEVSVLWSEVIPATSLSSFPQMVGGYHVLFDATSGRQGGIQYGDQLN
ncbi:Di-copper centre-containing protein [Lepidopterella palustris CBS 459.81]|uniref:tyrosinase n=1 Tax=Lepidopterella palustris CBS 459.81 TaxID=1314670 RepID=A0A8E2JHT1_9PEZI|nr:Di-copper centre-containing protein [Lepidopterella palustris CBS 459.81]